MTTISFTWLTRRDGNNCFVVEKSGTEIHQEFGPMPPHLVMPFISARRRLIALRAEKERASFVEPIDMGFLQ